MLYNICINSIYTTLSCFIHPNAFKFSLLLGMSKCRGDGLDRIADSYENYEDFLNSQITETDLFYLEVDYKLLLA